MDKEQNVGFQGPNVSGTGFCSRKHALYYFPRCFHSRNINKYYVLSYIVTFTSNIVFLFIFCISFTLSFLFAFLLLGKQNSLEALLTKGGS